MPVQFERSLFFLQVLVDLDLSLLPLVQKLIGNQFDGVWLYFLDKFHLVKIEWVEHALDAENILIITADIDESFLWMLLTHHAVLGRLRLFLGLRDQLLVSLRQFENIFADEALDLVRISNHAVLSCVTVGADLMLAG